MIFGKKKNAELEKQLEHYKAHLSILTHKMGTLPLLKCNKCNRIFVFGNVKEQKSNQFNDTRIVSCCPRCGSTNCSIAQKEDKE